jgi:hypothetical protein
MKKTKNNRNNKKIANNITKRNIKILPNKTPKNINMLSLMIFHDIKKDPVKAPVGSYSPTINKELVSLKSIQRTQFSDCNNNLAFELKEPLQISVPGQYYGKGCFPYNSLSAQKFLLKNLSANKHVDIKKIIPPVQSMSNCWFNTMFVVLFVSDKGRKFFHFFRQLMIEGNQSNGTKIPENLWTGLALLNYAIDSCLTGSQYAYTLNTNTIIQKIYESIPSEYKEKLPYIANIEEAGNPMRYYGSLIYYLHNKSLQLLFVSNANSLWKEKILSDVKKETHLPHFIILEFFDGSNKTAGLSGRVTNKPRSFLINGAKYMLDSCVIRDTTQQHFSATLTCEKKEMAYDGMSYHRLVPLEWTKYINSDYNWGFQGSNDSDGAPLKWNFLHGYQMLLYYRVK